MMARAGDIRLEVHVDQESVDEAIRQIKEADAKLARLDRIRLTVAKVELVAIARRSTSRDPVTTHGVAGG
jgi:hypothetical protein